MRRIWRSFDTTIWSRDLILFALVVFLARFGQGLLGAVRINFFIETIGLDQGQVLWLEGIRELPGLALIFLAALTMRLPISRQAVLAVLLMGIGYGLYAFVRSYTALLAMAIIASFGFHLWTPLNSAIGMSLSTKQNTGRVLGSLASVGALAAIAGMGAISLISRLFESMPLTNYYLVAGAFIDPGRPAAPVAAQPHRRDVGRAAAHPGHAQVLALLRPDLLLRRPQARPQQLHHARARREVRPPGLAGQHAYACQQRGQPAAGPLSRHADRPLRRAGDHPRRLRHPGPLLPGLRHPPLPARADGALGAHGPGGPDGHGPLDLRLPHRSGRGARAHALRRRDLRPYQFGRHALPGRRPGAHHPVRGLLPGCRGPDPDLDPVRPRARGTRLGGIATRSRRPQAPSSAGYRNRRRPVPIVHVAPRCPEQATLQNRRGRSYEKNSVVQAVDFRKVYGDVVAVDGISFEVRRGEIFGLLGPNGAGKTSTLECLEGLRSPTAACCR